jgi:hypothetical protein
MGSRSLLHSRGLYHKTYYARNLRISEIRVFVPGKPFQPSLVFVGKGLSGTNTSILGKSVITAVKSFMIQAPVEKAESGEGFLFSAAGFILRTAFF